MSILKDILKEKTFSNLAPQNYEGVVKAEKAIDNGKTVNIEKLLSKRYTYGNDIGMDAEEAEKEGDLTEGEKTNLKKSGRTGLYTARQMHEADIDTSVEDRPEYIQERDIDSTAIQSIKYNPKNKIVEILFRNGKHSYAYPDVPVQNVKEVIRAPSKGIAFNKKIKPYSVKGFRGSV